MKGFIESYAPREYVLSFKSIEKFLMKHHINRPLNDSGAFIMECFNPQTLPILNTLVDEFAVIDHWFAAVPMIVCFHLQLP